MATLSRATTATAMLRDDVAPLLSCTVATTVNPAADVGVPEIAPVVASMVSPGGRPVADHAYGAEPPEAVTTGVG